MGRIGPETGQIGIQAEPEAAAALSSGALIGRFSFGQRHRVDDHGPQWRWCTDPAPSVRHDRPPGHRSDGR